MNEGLFYSDFDDNDDIAYTPVVNLFPCETFSSSSKRLFTSIRLFVSAFSRINAKLRGIPTVIHALAKPFAISVNSFTKDLIVPAWREKVKQNRSPVSVPLQSLSRGALSDP